MRLHDSHRAEMVSQLLKGETFVVLQQKGNWTQIRCDYDGYTGWVHNKEWKKLTPEIEKQLKEEEQRAIATKATSPSEVANKDYLNAPYLWGGRSRHGVDCSGLVQVCFKACGIQLPRDCSQQVNEGVEVTSLEEAQKDDICFFVSYDKHVEKGQKPTHVGIYMGDGHIIHSSGQVRIDRLDKTGIYNEECQGYSHRLIAIKRIK